MIFSSHLRLAHNYWSIYGKKGGVCVDATCGNGLDSLYIAQTLLTPTSGRLFCIDIQPSAIQATQEILGKSTPQVILDRISYHCHSHTQFEFLPNYVDIFVYNLGYLPCSDKSCTTQAETTLISVKQAIERLSSNGIISIMSYPGHPAGKKELDYLLEFLSLLSNNYTVCRHQWSNRYRFPELFLIRKRGNDK